MCEKNFDEKKSMKVICPNCLKTQTITPFGRRITLSRKEHLVTCLNCNEDYNLDDVKIIGYVEKTKSVD